MRHLGSAVAWVSQQLVDFFSSLRGIRNGAPLLGSPSTSLIPIFRNIQPFSITPFTRRRDVLAPNTLDFFRLSYTRAVPALIFHLP